MEIKFSELDYIFEEDAFIIRPDSATNIPIKFFEIVEIRLDHTSGSSFKRRSSTRPCMTLKMKSGEEFRIEGLKRFMSSQEEREGFRDFVIEFHKQLKNHQRGIKFIGGINFPKAMSVALAVGGSALMVYQFKQEFISSEGVGAALCATVVGLITFFTSGHQYDPNKIPGKYLK